jgi:MFS family permease
MPPGTIAPARRDRLTGNQIRGFWAAWLGWLLDGTDSFIYALVLVPALKDLLPRSGKAADTANIGFYGGLLFALFLIGWGLSLIWGPLADRFGRVRTLALTILCYSAFTFACALATTVWQFALFRMLAGIGVGGEWSMGGTFVAEEWPESRREMGAGYMHTGYYFGFFLAAILNAIVGARYGWRVMFAIGGAPALLLAFIRYGVREPARFESHRRATSGRWKMRDAFNALFSDRLRRRTLLNSTYVLISIIGLWGGSVYGPTAITQLATGAGFSDARAAQLASYGTMLLSVGTILGCLAVPALAKALGRRGAQAVYFVVVFVAIAFGFGRAFYLADGALAWFMIALFFMGLGGANHAMYTLWLPEQYPTECRASAFAFTTSVGRFVGAGATFLVGAGVSYFHTIGTPVALTALAFLVGLALLPFGVETKGQPLP